MILTFDVSMSLYLAGAIAVVITGISKSGFAGGGAILAVPILSLVTSPQMAAAITMPLLLVIDVANVWRYRRDFHRPSLRQLLPGALVGLVIGYFTFEHISAAGMRLGVGALALYFSVLYFVQTSQKKQYRPIGPIVGAGLGALGGLGSFIAHAGGPPVDAFVLSQRLLKSNTVATLVYFFFIVNVLKIVAYSMLGQMNAPNMTISLFLLPFVPVSIFIGYFLHERITQDMFQRLCYFVLLCVGLKLLWDGMMSFW